MQDCDVLVAGGAGVDTIVRVDSLTLPERDSVMVPPILDYAGHGGNGVALGCHALGLRTRFVEVIGEDLQGTLLRDRYAREGLPFTPVHHPSGTRRSVNLVDREGRRLSFHDPRQPHDVRVTPETYLPLMRRSRHLHAVIVDWVRYVLDDARALGLTISTDLQDWDGLNPHHLDFAYGADLVTMSIVNVRDRYQDVMRDLIAKGRARVVAVTAGAEGSYVLVRGEDGIDHVPAVPPDRLVDTNGCGDAYVTAFLYGWLRGDAPVGCARLGSVAGAFACGIDGAHETFLGEAELVARAARAFGDRLPA